LSVRAGVLQASLVVGTAVFKLLLVLLLVGLPILLGLQRLCCATPLCLLQPLLLLLLLRVCMQLRDLGCAAEWPITKGPLSCYNLVPVFALPPLLLLLLLLRLLYLWLLENRRYA
jgi:hypothetical protein